MPIPEPAAADALGAGLQFPIQPSPRGGLALCRFEQKVEQSIWAILSTAKGERVMRPEFGCDLHDFVFASLNAANLTLIKSAVREALVRWEPRIEVRDVEASLDGKREGQLNLKVTYTIRVTNSAANLVYPFYLHPGI